MTLQTTSLIKSGFILEDHAPTQAWLSKALLQAFPGIDLSHAGSIQQAKNRLKRHNPDIALIDLALPDGSGIKIIELIRHQSDKTLIIVNTTFGDDEHLFAALQAGAQGYILKGQQPHQIIHQLQAAVTGKPALSSAIARRILAYFQPVSTSSMPLTSRQSEVLQLIAQGFKNREVAEMLNISIHTVSSYIKEIYSILGISSRSQATIEAGKRGLISFDSD